MQTVNKHVSNFPSRFLFDNIPLCRSLLDSSISTTVERSFVDFEEGIFGGGGGGGGEGRGRLVLLLFDETVAGCDAVSFGIECCSDATTCLSEPFVNEFAGFAGFEGFEGFEDFTGASLISHLN